MKDKVVAIVPAAGLGRRFCDGTNKSFKTLMGKPLLVWALETLETVDEITEIIPVLKEEDMEKGVEVFEEFGLSKIKRIAPGGKERQDSVYNGLKQVDDSTSIVVIHDGVRPLVGKNFILESIRQLKDCDGVIPGVPPKDTIKEVKDSIVKRTLKRDSLWAVQTPQVFFYKTLYAAYEKAMKDRFYTTDDAAIVERYGGRIKVIMGSYNNIKITTPEDLLIAEFFLSKKWKVRNGK
ncbi:MAG: 2-C-methyl-D-erythritol 4-phosphate cytidylyltransferase [Nitrospirota bacterium]